MAKEMWLASPVCAADLRSDVTAGTCGLPIWTLPHHSPIHQVTRDATIGAGQRRQNIHSCNNVQTILKVIEQGGGVDIVPHGMAAPAVEAGRLQPIFERAELPSLTLSAAIRSNENEVAVLRLFAQAVGLQL